MIGANPVLTDEDTSAVGDYCGLSRSDIDRLERVAAAESQEVRRDLRQTLLAGLALTVPFFITLLVLTWAFGAVSSALTPVVGLFTAIGAFEGPSPLLVKVIAALLLFAIVFVVGLVAHHGPNTHLSDRIDTMMEDIPGVGSVYTSVERMSDVLLEGDTQSFQEVKLVEFPTEDSFALAFLTAETGDAVTDAAGVDEMSTVFVPLAPNPVMGGHLVNLPDDRIHDVDLTVEEGMEAIMTTGVALDENAGEVV